MKHQTRTYLLLLIAVFCLPTTLQAEYNKNAIVDVHIHYNYDLWEAIPPANAIERLRKVGVSRAFVSSTSDEGTQKLYKENPEFVVPVLRTYRKLGTIDTWTTDETVIPYLKERLQKYTYAGIGELHLKGEQADSPVMREVVKLAKKYQIMLHIHSDADAINRVFKQDPQAKILWAHAGFENAATVEELMDQQENLWADLSFRREIYTNQNFLGTWKELLIKHADRFTLGLDTYIPQRWLQIERVMNWQYQLLDALPEKVAEKIAHDNGLKLIEENFKPKKPLVN